MPAVFCCNCTARIFTGSVCPVCASTLNRAAAASQSAADILILGHHGSAVLQTKLP